jgi:cobaltochelatase CobS
MLDALVAAVVSRLELPEPPELDEEKVRAICAEATEERVAELVSKLAVLSVRVERPDVPPVTLDGVHSMFPVALRLTAAGLHSYWHGGPGGGKSTAARQVAEALGRTFGYISLNPQTPDSRLLGFLDATGTYRRTVFRDCYEHGGIFCIDELDNAAPSLLTTINSALENGSAAFPDGLVERHKEFVLIGTGNTSGKGASPMFPERRPFDAAFAERFVYLEWTYDERLERAVALGHNPEAGTWVDFVLKLRQWASGNDPRLLVSPRASIRGAQLLALGFTPAEAADMAIFRGVDGDRRAKALSNVALPKGG